MPKRNNFNLSPDNEKELRRLIHNVNSKVYYQKKHHAELIDIIPQRTNITSLKERINSKTDYNRISKELKNFGKKDALKHKTVNGVTVSKWEHERTTANIRRVNQQRKRELEKVQKIEPDIMEIKTNRMGQPKGYQFKPLKKLHEINFNSQSDFNYYVKMVDSELASNNAGKYERYKQQYLEAIDKYLGGYGEELRNVIEQVPADLLMLGYYDDELTSIEFLSDPISAAVIADLVLDRWRQRLGGYGEEAFNSLPETDEDFFNI